MATGGTGASLISGSGSASTSTTSAAPVWVPTGRRELTWLLEYDLGGRVLRYASRTVEVPTLSGDVLLFRLGLDLGGELLVGEAQEATARITDPAIEWHDVVGRGTPPVWRHATIYAWFGEEILEDTLVVLDGETSEPEWGDPADPSTIVVSVLGYALDALSMIPGPQAVIDGTTWPNDRATPPFIDAQAVGVVYPTVFGCPGSGDTAVTQPFPAVPVPMATVDGTTASRILLSDGHIGATTVTIWNAEQLDALTGSIVIDDCAVVLGSDLLGQDVSLAEAPGGTPLDLDEEQEWYAGFNFPDGGVLRLGEVVRGLGDVLLYLLERASLAGVRVDLDAQRGQAAALNQFKIDGYVSTRFNPLALIDGDLASVFPIRRMRSGAGTWYRAINWAATAEHAVATLTAGPGGTAVRVSSVRPDVQLFNVFTLEYKRNGITGRHYSRRVLTATSGEFVPGLGVDERIVGSPLCAQSQSLFGVIERPSVGTGWTWSDLTANAVLGSWADRYALPRLRVSYATRVMGLLPGDAVVINDSQVGLSERVALVDQVRLESAPDWPVRLGLVVLPERLS